jgi:hypothetical protein
LKRFKVIAVLIVVGYAIIHLACTLLYVLPQEVIPEKVSASVTGYMSPLFNQGWALFAPVPTANRKVFVSYLKKDNTWSAWQDPFSEFKRKHWQHRYTGYGKLVLMQSTSLHNLYYENEDSLNKKSVFFGDKNTECFKVLRHEVEQILKSQKKEFREIRFLLMFISTGKPNKKNYIYYSN